MSLLGLIQAYKSPLTLLLVVFGPSLIPRILAFFLQRRHQRPQTESPPRPPLSVFIKALLVLHSGYYALQLLYPPFDLFTSNHLPLLTPNAVLRNHLLGSQSQSPSQLSNGTLAYPLEELLLQKLQSLDNRIAYARYGHAVLRDCVWCSNIQDYGVYAIPSILLPYVIEAVVIGLMGWNWIAGSSGGELIGGGGGGGGGGGVTKYRQKRWRSFFGWILFGAAVGEMGVKYAWEMRVVAGESLHLASTIHTFRSLALLLLPIIYNLLPLPIVPPHPTTLIPVLTNAQNTLRLSSLARSATRRDPVQKRASQAIRQDPGVVNAIQSSGIDLGQVRLNARRWIRDGWDGLIKVERAP